MVRCMSDLGLRVGEVVALTLDDIDWRQGVLKLLAGKGRRERLLPLPGPLGEAITAYLCADTAVAPQGDDPEEPFFLAGRGEIGSPDVGTAEQQGQGRAWVVAGDRRLSPTCVSFT